MGKIELDCSFLAGAAEAKRAAKAAKPPSKRKQKRDGDSNDNNDGISNLWYPLTIVNIEVFIKKRC